LGKTSTELLKSIERSRRETNVKIKSLSSLLEALDTVEEVLGRAADRFQANGGQDPPPLTKDLIDPNTLGVYFSYFKDLPLKVSSHLLRRKQADSKNELSALQKKQKRLETCQGTIPRMKDQIYSTLPKIEEDRLCTPKTSLAKVHRDENGLFKLTEEYTNMGDEEVEVSKIRSPTCLTMDSSDAYDHDCNLYSDLIDFDVMVKLDGMDPKTRGDYTSQFYRELFVESDWLHSAKKKDSTKGLVSGENKDRSSEQTIVSSRQPVRKRKKARPSSDLMKLFIGKKKGRTHPPRERRSQTQKAVQSQECSKEQLISESQSKRVSRRTQQGIPQQSCILQEDKPFPPFTAEPSDRSNHKAAGGRKQLKEQFSSFPLNEHAGILKNLPQL